VKPGVVLYKIKEALKLSEEDMLHIYSLENYKMEEDRLKAILSKPSKKNHQNATYEELGVFLDALIRYKRGDILNPPPEDAEIELDNNLIIKKLRIALQLKDMDIEAIFDLADRDISRSRLRDIFRSYEHPKYYPCPDALLNDFLIGLDEFFYDIKD